MEGQKIKVKNRIKMIASILLLLVILFSMLLGAKLLSSISFGSETEELFVEGNLEKYINYHLSDEDKGTFVQYHIKQKMEDGNTYVPIKNSEIIVSLSQIEGKYPTKVKAIAKATAITNGKVRGIEENYVYDANTGKVTIKASNQNEQGEILYKDQPSKEASDEYILFCYYDTYVEENPERNLKLDIAAKATLDMQDDFTIHTDHTIETKVAQNVGTITSVHHDVEDLYNGYMKSNKINGTNYHTTYKETNDVIVGKKEAQETLELLEKNSFIKVGQNQEEIANLGNNGNLIYKSTKIEKENLKKLLGEEGKVEIFDKEENVIATIDKETQYGEDGTITIQYESEPEEIKIKTSKIIEEGILSFEHTKEIKSTMTDLANTKIKTMTQIEGMDAEVANIVDIKEAQTNVKMNVNNAEWTNKQQNEITFDVSLSANTIKDNMFKNPELRIELPNQVEKVILQNSSIFHNNGLELQEPYIETNSNGNMVIVAKLTGTQTAYNENVLELSTDVKITATIILKKDIESVTSNTNITYTNQYTTDGSTETGNHEVPLKIENYQEEEMKPIVQEEVATFQQAQATQKQENQEELNTEGLKLEVAPVKGETNIANGDTIYAGEYIKYNVKITNTSDKPMKNIKIVGNVPEGTKYGEVKADYEEVKAGEYVYQFDETVKEKEIEIEELAAGQSIHKYYEIQANDLEEGQTEKQIESNVKAYIGQTEVATYTITNIVKPAEAKIFLGSALGNTMNQWLYRLSVEGEDREVTVKLKAPKEFTLVDIVLINSDNYADSRKVDLKQVANVAEDNVITLKINTNKEYWIIGYVKALDTTPETENAKAEITTVASVELNNVTYQSNENRILFSYPSVSISMKSDNEGEKVKYEDEINYEIVITNVGKPSTLEQADLMTQVNIKDFLPEHVEPVSVTYDNWEQEKINEKEDGSHQLTGKYRKIEPVTEEIDGILEDKDGTRLADIDLYLSIPHGQSVTINVKTKAGMVYEKTRIENSATVTGVGETAQEINGVPVIGASSPIKMKTSNIIAHTILPYNEEETSNPEDPTNPENPENPEDPNPEKPIVNPNKPEEPGQKYSITGTAWLDENEDGQRKSNEKPLSGITVMLVDAKNATTVKDNVKTNTDGSYRFTDLEKGDYVVVFKFDTNHYRVTQFQKNGVPNSANSDAITKELTLNGETMKVGVIDITNLEASVSNMDIGLIENKICDFKLDKSISKVTVTTNKGTKQNNYQDQKLAKIEIKAKEIEGATVVIEYKIVVTNEGELPATVGKVIDYLPEGLTFSSELNKNWSAQTNGQLINTSLSNRKMEAGESVTLTLIATKKMTSSSTGTFTNAAEIGDISNSLNIKDRDSTPGNKVKTEDDYSEAEVILSVSTGLAMYLSIGTIVVGMIGIAIFLAKKHGILKLGKISLFAIIVTAMLITSNKSIAAGAPGSDVFHLDLGVPYYNAFGHAGFTGTLTGSAWCNTPGAAYGSGESRTLSAYVATKVTYTVKKAADVEFTLERRQNQNGNYNVRIDKLNDNYYLYGPMNFYCDYEGQYVYSVKDGSGNEVEGYVVCDENGNNLDISNKKGELSFYIKVPSDKCQEGISKIEVGTTKRDTEIITETIWGKGNYTHPWAQDTLPDRWFIISQRDITKEKSKEKKITWTSINCMLDIEKVDKDDPNQKIPNVKIKVEKEDSNWEKTVITDENGKAETIKNIRPGTYRITEVENQNYGYRPEATGTATINPGVPLKYTLENKKHTGNLTILKKDEASGQNLEGFGFKLKTIDGDLEGNNKGKYIIAMDANNNAVRTAKGECHIVSLAYTNNIEEATEFVTDSTGKVQISNILIGNYEVVETSVGYYGYVLEDDYITWKIKTATGEDKEIKGQSVQVEVTEQKSNDTEGDNEDDSNSNVIEPINKKKYVKLSGYVWVDKIDGKTAERNDKYHGDTDLDAEDLLFNGIEVRLKNRTTGEMVKEPVKTAKRDLYTDIGNNGNGEYQFEDVLIEELENYYVEFEYDGLTYTNVIPLDQNKINRYNQDENRSENENYEEEEAKRSSKAAEGEERRRTFNESFSVIKGKDGQSGETEQTGIRVDAQGTEREDLKYEVEQQGQSEQTKDHAIATLKSQGDYTTDQENKVITQNNTTVPYPIQADTTITSYDIERNYDYQPATEEIRYINLGLTEREQPDIGIAKDIQNVKVAVNGKSHIYEYGQRFNNSGFTKQFLDNYTGSYYNLVDGKYQELPSGERGEYIKYQSPYKDEEEYVPVSQLIFNVGVRYGIKQIAGQQNNGATQEGYTTMSYRRAIYRSDYEYEEEDPSKKDNELKVYITYKIKMNIAKGNLFARINQIVDYYDARYEVVGVGTKIGNNCELTGENVQDITTPEEKQYNSKYNRLVLNTEGIGIIEGQKNLESDDGCVYVQFKLSREAVAKILEEQENSQNGEDLLNNVVEIKSYSVYNKEDGENYQVYAGINKYSNPGNSNPEDEKTYENDTDSSPALKLELADAREVAGKVFEDDVLPQNGKNPNDIMTEEIRQGDGKYTNGEKGIGGVEVTLAENVEGGGKVYKTQTIHADIAEKGKYGFALKEGIFVPEEYNESNKAQYAYTYDKTEHNGEDLQEGDFFIQGYIPGDYELIYTWGNNQYSVEESRKYTVQDYKGTIYDKTRNQDGKWWHEDKFNEDGKLKENYNEDGRLKAQNKQDVVRLTDATDNYDEDQEAPKGSRKQIDAEMKSMNQAEAEGMRTKMDSTTPVMEISVEYDDKVYNSSNGDRYTYLIDNLDFGIVERARQQLEITKAVTGVKMTLANGQVIIDAEIDPETGDITGIKDGLTYGPRSDNSIGFVKLEVDSELIQGATVEIQYTIQVENKGEKDYDCKEYYLYGTHKEDNELITMQPDVYDYLDNTLKLDDTNPNGWTEKSKDSYTSEIKYTTWKGNDVLDTIIETYYKEGEEITRPDGSKYKEWESGEKSIVNLLTEWYEERAEERTVRTVKLDAKTILENGELNKELKPGGKNRTTLTAKKILSNSDEIDLNNDTEITEVKNTKGTGTIPKIITSHLYDRGEMVTVTPPTGENKNNSMPIIIGVTSLILLGAGVIIIKKKVL